MFEGTHGTKSSATSWKGTFVSALIVSVMLSPFWENKRTHSFLLNDKESYLARLTMRINQSLDKTLLWSQHSIETTVYFIALRIRIN